MSMPAYRRVMNPLTPRMEYCKATGLQLLDVCRKCSPLSTHILYFTSAQQLLLGNKFYHLRL